jgi:hypothetical protein
MVHPSRGLGAATFQSDIRTEGANRWLHSGNPVVPQCPPDIGIGTARHNFLLIPSPR